jgi:hypothetical protein
MPMIPFLNMELSLAKEIIMEKVREPHNQRRLVLVIVSISCSLVKIKIGFGRSEFIRGSEVRRGRVNTQRLWVEPKQPCRV